MQGGYNMKKFIIIIFCLIINLLFSQNCKIYKDTKAGFSFKSPKDIIVWDGSSDKPKDIYIEINTYELPFEGDYDLGYNNENIIKVKKGLENGKIEGFPFNSKEFSNIIKIKNKYCIENYVLSLFTIEDIQFNHELIFFNKSYMIRIRVSADAYKNKIIKLYDNIFEKLDNGIDNPYIWKASPKDILTKIKKKENNIFSKWETVFKNIIESITFY